MWKCCSLLNHSDCALKVCVKWLFWFIKILWWIVNSQLYCASSSYSYLSHYVLFEWIIHQYFLYFKLFLTKRANPSPLLSSFFFLATIYPSRKIWFDFISLVSFVYTIPTIACLVSPLWSLNFSSFTIY